jgi:hypothetical protein
MMAEPQRFPGPGLTVGRKQMLFAVPVDEHGHEVVRYFTDQADGNSDVEDEGVRQALSVIGAWSDLDWEQALDELDRIRHASPPTPLIDEP